VNYSISIRNAGHISGKKLDRERLAELKGVRVLISPRLRGGTVGSRCRREEAELKKVQDRGEN